MARQIEDLFVRLKLEGFENLDKIKGSFRELNKVTGFTETEVAKLRKEILDFGKTAGNTEAASKGIISVLQGLRTQADMCGNAYAELSRDIKNLEAVSRGSSDALEKQRQALLNSAGAGRQNADSLHRQIDALKQLQRETRPGSSAFIQLGKDIDTVTVKLGKLKSEAQAFNLALNQQAGATPSVLNNQIAILQRGLQNVRYDAEQFVNTLRQIQLLQITQSGRAGRAGVIASFEAYQSREYLRGFADPSRLREMPGTMAAIRLRISEINSELENITGYRRRRDLTLELKDLNRQLKNSVLDVTSQEDLALQRLRARVAAQRELNRASGFLAFSRKVSGGEYDPAITRSIEKARRSRGLVSPEQQAVINETTAQLERSSIEASNAVREATTRNIQLEIRALQLKNEEADRLNAELIASNKRVVDAEVATFDRLLAARDRYATSKGFAKQYLGLSGQELSPFYQQVVELGIGAAGTQAGKYQKRDFRRVLIDTIDSFNLQLTESGRTAVEGMGYFKEAAIAHAGGSEKVRRVLDRWDKDAIPANMFPLVGEQGDAYRRRIEEGSNLFKQVIDTFRNTLNRSGKTLSTSADQIRDSAVSFAAQAGRGKEVSTALGRFGAAGNVPMFMLPGTGETPEAYATRITGAAPAQIPQLGDVRQSSLRKLLDMQQLLQEIRYDVPPIGKEFANLDRQISQSLNKIDREIGRRQGAGRLSGMQLAQGVGAALSGGIFGGPEGLIGGLGGLVVGGVGGAFAGAAFGAQAGMLRQQLGAVTEYSAGIDKLQIALRGIVGSQEAYSQALAAAASVTRDLNIPQETAIQGMTRLSAAVKGAGGTVSDSAFAFRAINEAVKATGGGAEQADGALLALTQVFSKGKVSAEELNQIAERLPGTFTLFAEAAGKSGPELQKALQEGKVGLNDLMKFLQLISSNYGQTALKIAKSSQEAGARLSVAMKNMQLEVGRALQPIGAQLQGAFTNFIVGITPATVAAANAVSMAIGGMYKGISAGLDLLVSMRGLFINLTKAMLVFGGATAGVFIATNIGTFANALKGVLVVMRGILSIEKALLFVENARVAAQALLVGLTSGATKGKVAGLVLGAGAGVAAAVGLGKLTEQVTANIEKGLSGALKSVDTKLPQLTQFSTPTASASEGGGTGKGRESLARKLQQNFDSTIAQLGRQFNAAAKDKLYETVLQYEDQIQKAYKKNNITLAEELKLKQKAAALDITEEVLLSEKTALLTKLSEARSKGLEVQDVQNRLDNVNAELKQLQADRAKDYTAELEKQAQKAKELRDVMQQVFAPSSASMGVFGGLSSAQDYTFGEGDTFQTPGTANGTDRIKELKDELRSLTSPVTQVLTAAESIGSAFSASFSSIVTGASTARQSLATLFNSIATSFMDMATKIVAKWIEMAILNTVLKLLPGGAGFGVGSAQLDLPGLSGAGALSGARASAGGFYDGVKLNALGAAYAANGIQPFAMGGTFSRGITAFATGGVVKRPTMFAFANGGAGRLGLMGEAGPEAIMPLRRLPSGRLGVESAGGGGTNVVVNVDASGSQVQGNSADASQLGKVLSAAVQQELINQQRPGGLLAPKR